MTYAIIQTGGKQLRVEPGRFYDIELLPVEPDETITLETVLLVQHDGEVTIGQPFIDGATVEGKVLRHLRGRKVLVYKMKPKKKTRKKRGHRQEITRLMINSISLNGSTFAAEAGMVDVDTNAEVATPVQSESDAETVAQVAAEPATVPLADDDTNAEVTSEVAAETGAEMAADLAGETNTETAAEVAAEVVAELDGETASQPGSEQ